MRSPLWILLLLVAGLTADTRQVPTAARLREAHVPQIPAVAYGGGEVMFEVTVDPSGTVSRIARLRATEPFTEPFAQAVGAWRFEPATTWVDEQRRPTAGQVLVIGLIGPPALYAAPAPRGTVDVRAHPSERVPGLLSAGMPPYPPTATGHFVVLVELTVTVRDGPTNYRVLTPPSGFDAAALAAARTWRFTSPARAPADPLYVYAILAFRAPVVVQ
jgi:hypothetical protein